MCGNSGNCIFEQHYKGTTQKVFRQPEKDKTRFMLPEKVDWV
ncbi:hypothetical protein ACKLNO_02650 [Neisseriaceae bacterium B1]